MIRVIRGRGPGHMRGLNVVSVHVVDVNVAKGGSELDRQREQRQRRNPAPPSEAIHPNPLIQVPLAGDY